MRDVHHIIVYLRSIRCTCKEKRLTIEGSRTMSILLTAADEYHYLHAYTSVALMWDVANILITDWFWLIQDDINN